MDELWLSYLRETASHLDDAVVQMVAILTWDGRRESLEEIKANIQACRDRISKFVSELHD